MVSEHCCRLAEIPKESLKSPWYSVYQELEVIPESPPSILPEFLP